MTRRLLCAGEVVVDLVLSVPGLPPRGGDVLATTGEIHVGGAYNVMSAAARHGVPVTYAGLLGTGPLADRAIEALGTERINAPLRRVTDVDTGLVIALVEPDGERTFVTTLGAEAQLRADDLDALQVRSGDVVHVSGYGLAYPGNGPVLARWVTALPPDTTLLFDPGPLVREIPPAVLDLVLRRCDWISCSESEALALDVDNPADLADTMEATAGRLLGLVRAGVVVRLGDRGAIVATPATSPVLVPPFSVAAVDSTGAGDAHVGCFIAALAHESQRLDPVAATRRANAAAALSVTKHGPAAGPSAAELDNFFADRSA